MPRQHRVTIKEIARMTGVSTQTVSRVINNRPDVSPETRRAVEAAIEEHGFQPSAVARSLVQRRSQMIGVIAAGLKYFGVAQTVNGIAEAAEAAGYSVILKELASFDVPDIAPVVDFFVAHRVEGIIFAPPQMGANIRHVQEGLPKSTPPVVFLKAEPSPALYDDRDRQRRRWPARRPVTWWPSAGGGSPTCPGRSSGARRATAGTAGWRRSRRRAWSRARWRQATGRRPVGPARSRGILAADPAVDGLFAASDQMALGALHIANQRGVRIPAQLAVVGFDGFPEAAEFTPSLTTREPAS